MDTVTLNNGISMPIIGFGTCRIAPVQTWALVEKALEKGYRLIDTAQNYGNEREVGQAIAASGIPR